MEMFNSILRSHFEEVGGWSLLAARVRFHVRRTCMYVAADPPAFLPAISRVLVYFQV